MNLVRVLLALAVVMFLGAGAHAADRVVLPTNVDPVHYDVSITPDAQRLVFSGTVRIDIEVRQATRDIVLNSANMKFSRVQLSGSKQEPQVSFDEKNETATFSFPSAIAGGRHRLTIEYSGKIFENAAGLFALDYASGNGKKRALFTQFENSDARRFVPCWDEPNRKATFSLTVTVPRRDLAVSNTPVARTERAGRGLKRVRFAMTPRMSTYLLFFSTGDLERVSSRSGKVDIGIVVKRGERAKAQYALDAAVKILPFLQDYFGVAYPLPKLDFIAGPGSSQFFGAMENWGAIFYFERAILVDRKTTTESDKRRIFNVIAHEMAHQWFGDLVTMDWWEDLWLNEGFATWMASKVSNHFHPEWSVFLDMVDSKDRAMARDAREGTHPVIQPIVDVMQASQAFDAITYQKGSSVIRMLEDYVGSDIFRTGVRNYISAHAYANAVTDDLWRELDKVSATKVSDIAHDFTLQDGIPLITVEASDNGITLSEQRFGLDRSRDRSHVWRVPVIAADADGSSPWRGVVPGPAPTQVPVSGPRGVLVNFGQSGYYKALYRGALFQKLSDAFASLPAADQLGLLYDTRMLGYAGDVPLSQLFELASKAQSSMHPRVLTVLAERLSSLDTYYDRLPSQAPYRAFALKVLNPIFARVGWKAKRHESANHPLLRAALLEALSNLRDPAIIAEANRRFVGLAAHPAALSADERRIVLGIAARHADAATWERLHRLARGTANTVERERYYVLLATAGDAKLVKRALDLTLTPEIAATTRPAMLAAASALFPEMAFDFASEHYDAVTTWLEPTSQHRFFPNLISQAVEERLVDKLKVFADQHIPSTARRATDVSASQILLNASIRSKRLPETVDWLAAHGYR
ncbi:MAG: M1 family metallopeptidase [Micropepsaceae bacterium]